MTQERKHSPLPWSRNINAKYPIYSQVVREDVRHICSMVHNESTTDEEKEANLAFIVRACNSHYKLVEAAKAILNSKGWGRYCQVSPFKELTEAVAEAEAQS